MSTSTFKKVGQVPVESGRILLVDPCYISHVDEHGNATDPSCELTMVETRQDGLFDVLADVDANGVITEIRIVLPDALRSVCRQWATDRQQAKL